MRRQAQIEEMERQREALKRAQAEEEERAREARKKAEREAAAAREAEARVGRTITLLFHCGNLTFQLSCIASHSILLSCTYPTRLFVTGVMGWYLSEHGISACTLSLVCHLACLVCKLHEITTISFARRL